MTRLDSSGNVDRIEGSRWSFSWSGDLRYRSGSAFENHAEYEQISPRFHRLMFQRPIEDGGFLRFGRFVPIELPGIGYVDGVQGETRRNEGLRLGVVTGLKPDRVDLDASADEPFIAGYASLEAGRRGGSYYSGTIGLLNTYYQGEMDHLALLPEQRVGLGPGFTLYSTAEVDLDAGAAQTRDGVSLTRLDVFAESRLSSAIRLRAGADHWERPDNQAERDLLAIDDERFFDTGYWRYWADSYQKLPWSLQLYEEVSLIDSDNTDDTTRWQVRLTRTGLFDMRNASISLTAYTLAADASHGYGCRASGYFPLCGGKLTGQSAREMSQYRHSPQLGILAAGSAPPILRIVWRNSSLSSSSIFDEGTSTSVLPYTRRGYFIDLRSIARIITAGMIYWRNLWVIFVTTWSRRRGIRRGFSRRRWMWSSSIPMRTRIRRRRR